MSKTKVRDSALNAIKRYMQSSQADALTLDNEIVETHVQLLDEQWIRFCEAQQEVEVSCGEELAPIELQSRIQAEDWYTTAKANFKRFIKAHAQPVSPASTFSSSAASSAAQLPKIQLPTFSGDPIDWTSFYDTFQSLVHQNANLSNSQKLHYLRNCLKGEALHLISSLAICDGNYSEAWDLLTARYKVMRVMVDSHLKALSAIEMANRDSSKDIKHVLNATLQHVSSLRTLGRPVDFWDDWLVHLTVSKLAYETRKQWELSLVDDHLSTFTELVEFLEARARSLGMLLTTVTTGTATHGGKHFGKTPKSTMNVLHAVGQPCTSTSKPETAVTAALACLFCNASHKIYSCPSFRQLNVDARLTAVKKEAACINCLSKGHLLAKCRSASSCQICHRRHHTLLHKISEDNAITQELNAHAIPYNAHQIQPHAHQSHAIAQAFFATHQALHHTTDASTAEEAKSATPLPVPGKETTLTAARGINSPAHVVKTNEKSLIDADLITSHYVNADRTILLATAEIYLHDHAGRWQPARVLFDNGSHASFVTEACIQRLRLPRKSSLAYVTGIGALQCGRVKGETTLFLSSRSLDQCFTINALILSKITNDLPTVNVQVSPWPHIHELSLADQNFAKPRPIDILIGMDEMDKFLLPEFRKGSLGSPMAQNTVFGWVLFGNAQCSSSPVTEVTTLHCDLGLIGMVSKFWELEEFPRRKHHTAEETLCEEHFQQNFRRAEDGRFVVRLPFKESVLLGESRNVAINSLLRMEKRFVANEQLRLQYCKFMQELIDMGHMELASSTASKSYYMPHHAVVKETSTTTKLRVVFNASMKTSSGFSLNDALAVGPQLQEDLFSILVRFRTHRFAIIADIEKMYRQIYVAEEDVDYQRIVWRPDPNSPIRDYRLLRVTYGVAPASYLAVKCMHQAALDSVQTHEKASAVIIRDFYMDDLLTGSSTADELTKLQKGISDVLSRSGFELRKWATNCTELIENIPHAAGQISHLLADGDEIRTLGIIWNPIDDLLSVAVDVTEPSTTITKRRFLSETSKVFDPLGVIAPCTIRAKIWLQQIWSADVDWDEPVPSLVAEEWLLHRQELPKLSALKLNRWLGTGRVPGNAEFHIFTDASQRAYAAALYCRTQRADGTISAVLVAARARVAPLKSTSLPRLELCAAHLGSKLVKQVQTSFGCPLHKLYAWSDSTVTLAWLQGHPSRWSTFVANRVAEVQEVLAPERWRHVRSEHNPADCASRGVTPSQLLMHPLWWHGPPWLSEVHAHWHCQTEQHTTDLELRKIKGSSHLTHIVEDWDLLTKYHSYTKLKRITAYVIRFVKNLRAGAREHAVGPLSSNDISDAEITLVKYTQLTAFAREISSYKSNKQIPLRSPLLRLRPFLDEIGILRVGGRLSRASLSTDMKYPIVLPKNSALARVIILDIHIATLHAGPQIMQTVLQRRFWVLGSRGIVRAIYRNCVLCKRMNRQPLGQIMADLPVSRTLSTRCFLHSAVDFAGPYAIKFSHGRGAKSIKAYICNFICMSTGAMHIELVSDLSAAAFIRAFKRFVNRRGYCQHVYSDNGTNFVGAEKELQVAYQRCIADENMSSYLANSRITWHFNPPSAPHMGGYWEAGVKRIKYHLKRALGPTLLTYEEFATLLTEVEACVNSRPLCPQTANVDDLDALTPGHFIMGEPLKALPEPDTQNFSGNLHQRWQTISAMRQHFWSRWRNEYLVSLQRRTKWFRPTSNVKENDVVIIHDSNAPPTKWKIGRVIESYPGTDKQVRVVKLKTSDGELVRPVAKLSLLPTKSHIFSL